MKYLLIVAAMLASLYAADFGHMSTEEMMKMRGNVPVDQREDFRKEMQKRMQSMTQQERQKYSRMGQGMQQSQGMVKGNQGLKCGGQGMMTNQGMNQGQGMMM